MDIKIEKTPKLEIRIYKQEYNEKEYHHIREWYLNKDDEWRPSPKGVAFLPEQWEEFVKEIKKLK